MKRVELVNSLTKGLNRFITYGNVIWGISDEGIICHKMQKKGDGWESLTWTEEEHPPYSTCPTTFLSDCPDVKNALWRESVKESRRFNTSNRVSLLEAFYGKGPDEELCVTLKSKAGFWFPKSLQSNFYNMDEMISSKEFYSIIASGQQDKIDLLSVSVEMKVEDVIGKIVICRAPSNRRYSIQMRLVYKLEIRKKERQMICQQNIHSN